MAKVDRTDPVEAGLIEAIEVLRKVAKSRNSSPSVKVSAAKGIIAAAAAARRTPAQASRSPSEMTLGELEEEISRVRERLQLIGPAGGHG